jgi:hypothetical protein
METPADHRAPGVAAKPFRARRELDLIGMRKLEGELRRGRMPASRIRLEAAQDELLEPRG